jgi:hypothetical protein
MDCPVKPPVKPEEDNGDGVPGLDPGSTLITSFWPLEAVIAAAAANTFHAVVVWTASRPRIKSGGTVD